MRIALDYDRTYTLAPDFWDRFIKGAQEDGHTVVCITMRYPSEAVEMLCEVFYTERKAKENIGKEQQIDVWIDDNPYHIYFDAR